MSSFLGQVLNNRYRIDVLLGKGGMGAVYRAWDKNLKMPVAVKVNSDASEEAQRQFEREAGILAHLSHPNLPRVIDYFFIPDQGQYLVMDFVEGEDLKSILDRLGVLRESDAVTWILQVCDALSYLHSQPSPIIHRDIKPANIKIRPDGRAMLVDFGIAKIYDPASSTTVGAQAVTPGYSPPEQYGCGMTDARSDVYALGATLYHLLTGRILPESIHRMVHVATMALPRQLDQSISPAAEQAIIAAVSITTDRRFQSVEEFRTALTRRPIITPSTALAQFPQAGSAQSIPQKRRLPRGFWFAAIVGMTVVVVSVLALSGVFNAREPTPNAIHVAQVTDLPTVTTEPTSTGVPPTATSQHTPTPSPTPAPTAVSTSTPLPTSTPVPMPVVVYEPVSIGAVTNATLDFESPPAGAVTLGEVSFYLSEGVFKSQASSPPNDGYPTDVLLPVDVPQAYRVHLLLNAGNGLNQFEGKTIGQVVAHCGGNAINVAELKLGQDVREWHVAHNVICIASRAQQVWDGALANYPNLTGHIDMLSLDLPNACQEERLTALEIIDCSDSSGNSLDPALNLIGVTVEHYQ